MAVPAGMHSLLAEDDFTSRNLLARVLAPLGACDVASNGNEAVVAFEQKMRTSDRYGLVCLDIGMPGLNGQEVLLAIRALEEKWSVPLAERCLIFMTTAHDDAKSVISAFRGECDGYLVKPVTREKVSALLLRTKRSPRHA